MMSVVEAALGGNSSANSGVTSSGSIVIGITSTSSTAAAISSNASTSTGTVNMVSVKDFKILKWDCHYEECWMFLKHLVCNSQGVKVGVSIPAAVLYGLPPTSIFDCIMEGRQCKTQYMSMPVCF